MRGGIRVRADSISLEVDIRNANGDVEYIYCNKQTNSEHFMPFVGVLASNQDALNDIDLGAVYVKNLEPNHYTDSGALE